MYCLLSSLRYSLDRLMFSSSADTRFVSLMKIVSYRGGMIDKWIIAKKRETLV